MKELWRCRFTKLRTARFLSQLDVLRSLERVFRRAGIDLVLSGGYHPHPLLSFGPALAVGIESVSEYFDAMLTKAQFREELMERLNAVMLEGLSIRDAVSRITPSVSLAATIDTASYRLRLEKIPEDDLFSPLLDREDLLVERKDQRGKARTVNLRPLVLDLDCSRLDRAQLGLLAVTGSHGNLRPAELLSLIPGSKMRRVLRTGLYQRRNGLLFDPMYDQQASWKELTWTRE